MKRMTVKKLCLNGLSVLLLLNLVACGELDDKDSGGVYRQTDYDPWYRHDHLYYDDDWYDVPPPPYALPGKPDKPLDPSLKPSHPIVYPDRKPTHPIALPEERSGARPSSMERRPPSIPSRARPSYSNRGMRAGGGFRGGGGGFRGGGGGRGGGRR